MRKPSVPELLDLIYAAACDPALWRPTLESLTLAMGGIGANFMAMDVRNHASCVQMGIGNVSAEFERDYPGFMPTDPFYVYATRNSLFNEGLVAIGEAVVPDSVLRRSDFYNEFGKAHDYFGGLSAVVTVNAQQCATVSVHRRRNHSFGVEQVALVRTLMPHLARALKVHTHLAAIQAREASLRAVLDRLATGAMLIGRRGAVVFANTSARETLSLRDGLFLDAGELRAEQASDTAALRSAIRDAAAIAEGHGLAGGGLLRIARSSGDRPLQVVVSPLPDNAALDERQASAMVFVSDPARASVASVDLLRRVHRLSRAEATVAQLVADGLTPREIGDRLGVSINTVRFHLKNLFAKTGTSRQGDLIRVLSATAQVLVQPDGD